MKRNDWLVAIAMALCVIGLVACGGGGSSSGGNGESDSREEAGIEFAECMREHGVEMEDPEPGQSISIDGRDDPATKSALAACDDKLGDGQELSPAEDEEFREGWLAFSQCVREQGIDLADPEFPGSGKVLLGIAGVDTSSPAFEAALEACEDEAPDSDAVGIGG
jgi:hypothetical protein